jgi:phospholipase/carboxylesterase
MDLLHTAHVPAGDGPFPTIVALHGFGASAHDLFGLAPHLHGGRALVLCPQGPIELQVGPGMAGYGWFPITMGAPPDPVAFRAAAARVDAFLSAAQSHYPVDPRRLVVMGFSQGGVMAYDLVLRDPGRFAGLVAMSSWLPNDLANAIEGAMDTGADAREALAHLPVMVTHGTRDPMIDVARARESRDRLIQMGSSPVYREYEMEHGISPEALREIVAWLEERVLSPILVA